MSQIHGFITIFAFLVKPGRIGTDDVLRVRDDLFKPYTLLFFKSVKRSLFLMVKKTKNSVHLKDFVDLKNH